MHLSLHRRSTHDINSSDPFLPAIAPVRASSLRKRLPGAFDWPDIPQITGRIRPFGRHLVGDATALQRRQR
jgi:hypothetical protein